MNAYTFEKHLVYLLINMRTLFQENIELSVMNIKISDRSNYA